MQGSLIEHVLDASSQRRVSQEVAEELLSIDLQLVIAPHGVENLLMAGRAVGSDRISHAATRNMPCCVVTEQGARIVAAIAVKFGRSLRDIDRIALQEDLLRQGFGFDN